jgi:hypothetical protein
MLIAFLKFFHLLLILGLLSASLYSFVSGPRYQRAILWITVLSVLTGSLLVYPTHFTFHTPWIQAAYVFAGLYSVGILITLKYPSRIVCFILLWLLLFALHDAVTKTTFLWPII